MMIEMDRESLERKRRIVLAVAAYSYEYMDHSIMTDYEYDRVSRLIDTSIDTGHPVMDQFFREKFDPDTGQWIGDHPELDRVESLYLKHYAGRENIVMK